MTDNYKVVCKVCGAEYQDEESVALVKKWLENGYAPCPNISCPGEMEVKVDPEVGIEERDKKFREEFPEDPDMEVRDDQEE